MNNNLPVLMHSLQHVMVLAIRRLFGFDFALGVGPVIENGFYQDLDFSITPEEFPVLEAEMERIIQEDLEIRMELLPIDNAIGFFEHSKQNYKVELLNDIKAFGTSRADKNLQEEFEDVAFRTADGHVSIYHFDRHVDLCRGPHVKRTGELRALKFKLDRVAGAYWRGNEANKMLCRVYALAFSSEEELASFIYNRDEAKRRDHRRLGEQLELFFFHPSAPGMAYWLPKGVALKNTLIQYWREYHLERDYKEIQSPILNKRELWEISGHWRYYQEDMFKVDSGGEQWALKPMNCANAMLVWKYKQRSYRDLPFRLSDTDILHRNERTGTLQGLFRARCFCQDDSHNFVSEEQIGSEISAILQIVKDFYGIFELSENVHLYLSTRPDDFMGDVATWDKAEAELRYALAGSALHYGLKEKDGAFYGPKIDIHLRDSLNREWQCGTIQLDFQLPRNFGLEYSSKDGSRRTPIVIHRVIYGSLERFIGIIIEHFAGRFPFWIAPIQLRVLPVKNVPSDYARQITERLSTHFLQKPLRNNKLRFDIDDRAESLSRRVRDAEVDKIPLLLIYGPRDEKNRTVVLRHRGQDKEVPLDSLIPSIDEFGAMHLA